MANTPSQPQRYVTLSELQAPLTTEEQQFIADMGIDGDFHRYPAYSSPVDTSLLLAKVSWQFDQVPSYVSRAIED
jgi:hypothetical protein